MALKQSAAIDRWLDYDLRLDTSALSAQECAENIIDALQRETSGAFERTKARRTAARSVV